MQPPALPASGMLMLALTASASYPKSSMTTKTHPLLSPHTHLLRPFSTPSLPLPWSASWPLSVTGTSPLKPFKNLSAIAWVDSLKSRPTTTTTVGLSPQPARGAGGLLLHRPLSPSFSIPPTCPRLIPLNINELRLGQLSPFCRPCSARGLPLSSPVALLFRFGLNANAGFFAFVARIGNVLYTRRQSTPGHIPVPHIAPRTRLPFTHNDVYACMHCAHHSWRSGTSALHSGRTRAL